MSKPIALIGWGGHAKVCNEILNICGTPATLVITKNKESMTNGLECPTIDEEDFLRKYKPDEFDIVNGIGILPGKLKLLRRNVWTKFKNFGFHFITIAHPSAIVSESTELGEGSQIMAGCVIQLGVRIGQCSIINTRSSVDHDCYVGDHVHVAPGCTLCGNVTLEENVFVGAGNTLIPSTIVREDMNLPAQHFFAKHKIP